MLTQAQQKQPTAWQNAHFSLKKCIQIEFTHNSYHTTENLNFQKHVTSNSAKTHVKK